MAVQFPAFCPHCGLIFDSRLLGISGDVTGIVLEGNREQCPRCGGWAELPDGTFDVVDDTIRVLSASALTRERLLRLQTVLDAAQAGRMSEDEAAQAVADEAPELAGFIERLRPTMGRALIHLLLMVVGILLAQAVAEYRDHAATREDVQHAVEQAIQDCRAEGP